MKFRKKPVVIEATQWFKNGDHPEDDCRMIDGTAWGRKPSMFQSEGKVVRRFCHPDVPGNKPCEQCGLPHHIHGWIDTLEQGHRVCPGDWIITGVQGERYPCKPDIFAATYEPVVEAEETTDAQATADSAGAMAAAWFGTTGAGEAIDAVFDTVDPAVAVQIKRAATRKKMMSNWVPTTDLLMLRRMGKTSEEAAELIAVTSRCIIQGIDEIDPGTGKVNRARLQDELADVQAQIGCTVLALGLDQDYMARRTAEKIRQMDEWEVVVKEAVTAAITGRAPGEG